MRFMPKSAPLILALSAFGFTGYVIYYFLKKDENDKKRTWDDNLQFKYSSLNIVKNGISLKRDEETKNRKNITLNNNGLDRDIFRNGRKRNTTDPTHCEQYDPDQYETYDLWIPHQSILRIFSSEEKYKAVENNTGAKLKIYNDSSELHSRRITILGKTGQVCTAITMLAEMLKETDLIGDTITTFSPGYREFESKSTIAQPKLVKEIKKLVVIITEADNPFRFWVQIQNSTEPNTGLDDLNFFDGISEYYNNPENRKQHILETVDVGDLIAVPLKDKNKWYRGEIIHADFDSSILKWNVTVFCVDFGFHCRFVESNIYELRTDFLQLPFKAVECKLGSIEPVNGVWPQKAVERFKEICQVDSQSYRLIARVIRYETRQRIRANEEEAFRVPVVDLCDPTGHVNIGQILVEQSFACYEFLDTSFKEHPQIS